MIESETFNSNYNANHNFVGLHRFTLSNNKIRFVNVDEQGNISKGILTNYCCEKLYQKYISNVNDICQTC